jgi:hypothetical protein
MTSHAEPLIPDSSDLSHFEESLFMHARSVSALVLWISAAIFTLVAPARGDFKDDRLGMTIQTPKGWTTIPMSVDERWKVAKFLSDKSYFWTEKGGWTEEHKPTMEIIAFVDAAVKEKVKVEKKTDKAGNTSYRELIENPYKDYKDFLTRRYTGGGWFISKEETSKVGDINVTCYEIKVDKLSQDGPKHMFTWVYHVPEVDIAVQFEVLENTVDKLKGDLMRCLKSFKAVQRAGGPLYEPATVGERFSWLDQDKLTPEERKAKRQGMEQKAHDKAAKNLPEGWTAKKMGRFLVLNHADEKFAKAIVDQAEAVWSWLDATFPFVGKDEYVRSPILRICKNEAEMVAFFRSGDWFGMNDLEITTCQDFGGKTSYQLERVNRDVMNGWLRDKNWELSAAIPGWLGAGLFEFVGGLHSKGGKAEFSIDSWNKDQVRELERGGKLVPLHDFVLLPRQSFMADYWHKRMQASLLMAFFVTGKAAHEKRTKDLLVEYVRNLQTILKEETAAGGAKGDEPAKKPQTEEEEDALFRNRAQGLKQKEQHFLDEAAKRTFTGWTAADWKSFDEAFQKSF